MIGTDMIDPITGKLKKKKLGDETMLNQGKGRKAGTLIRPAGAEGNTGITGGIEMTDRRYL
jgi:hypothetical protein